MLFHKVSVESFRCLSTCIEFSRSIRIFAIFTIEMIGKETKPLHNFVHLSSKAINESETLHMLRRDVFASPGTISCENFYPVKSYDKQI